MAGACAFAGAAHGDGRWDVGLAEGGAGSGGGAGWRAGGRGEFGTRGLDALFELLDLADQAADLSEGCG